MIYTVTLNPSLDYIISVNDFKMGKTNRTETETIYPGGKGINVSIMLANLGVKSRALGFIAGFTGDKIETELKIQNIETDFIKLSEGQSRINIKIKNYEGTEINASGPEIVNDAVKSFYETIDSLKAGDYLVLAGSLPKSWPESFYSSIMERIKDREIRFVVDATNDSLLNALKYHPFLVKPNNFELGEIFNVDIESKEDAIKYAKELQEKGAANVLVSMASKGAVLVDENNQIYMLDAIKGDAINSVGSGDSMIAGFIASFSQNANYKEAFELAVAAGTANAFSEYFPTKEQVFAIKEKLYNEQIEK